MRVYNAEVMVQRLGVQVEGRTENGAVEGVMLRGIDVSIPSPSRPCAPEIRVYGLGVGIESFAGSWFRSVDSGFGFRVGGLALNFRF